MRFFKISIIYIFLLLFSSIGVQTAKAGDHNEVEPLITANESIIDYVTTIMILRNVFRIDIPSFWEMTALDNPFLGFVPDGKPPRFDAPNIVMEYSDESDPVPEKPVNTKPAEKPSKPLTPQEEEMRDAWKKAWEKTWGEPWPTWVDGTQKGTSEGDKNEWEGLEEEFSEEDYIPFKGEGEDADEDEEMKPGEGHGGGLLGEIERLKQELEKCKDESCRKQVQDKINRAMAEAAKALNELSRDKKNEQKVVPPGGEEMKEQYGGIIGLMQDVLKDVQESSNNTEGNE